MQTIFNSLARSNWHSRASDTYVKTQSSASLKMRVNSIYFGDLTNNATNKENYDKNVSFDPNPEYAKASKFEN